MWKEDGTPGWKMPVPYIFITIPITKCLDWLSEKLELPSWLKPFGKKEPHQEESITYNKNLFFQEVSFKDAVVKK